MPRWDLRTKDAVAFFSILRSSVTRASSRFKRLISVAGAAVCDLARGDLANCVFHVHSGLGLIRRPRRPFAGRISQINKLCLNTLFELAP